MSYTVIWKPAAEASLTHLWNVAKDRNSITSAADGIDAALKLDPTHQGESRSGEMRVMWNGPLGVLFEVAEPDRRLSSIAFGQCAASNPKA